MNITERILRAKADYDEVYDAGKQAEYDRFWDGYQDYGNRKDYGYAFYGVGWTDETYKPNYIPKPTKASNMYRSSLIKCSEEEPLEVDFSNSTDVSYAFYYSRFVAIGVLDCRNAPNINGLLAANQYLKKVENIILKDDGSQALDYVFSDAYGLIDIRFEGVIGKTFTMAQCLKLNKESFVSVINVLSTTTSGLTVTFNKTAVNTAFGINVDDPTTYPEGSEFYELRNSKSNWTFAYK